MNTYVQKLPSKITIAFFWKSFRNIITECLSFSWKTVKSHQINYDSIIRVHSPINQLLSNTHKGRVVLNCQHSSWADVEAEFPQGSILGPLLS